MSGFTKLVPEIVQSSIWNEPSDVRIVWITLLAIKDENGYVRGNDQTIARLANVPLESAQQALQRFQAPDPSSNTPDREGRRIEPIPGGWFVINHSIYRAKTYNEYEAERKKKYRASHADMSGTCPGHVPDCSASASASVSVTEGVQGEKPKPARYVDPIVWTPEGSFKGITSKDYDAWELAYPATIIDQELEKANQWLLGNPAKAKKKQWRKFITGWLARSQERGGR